MNIRSLDTLKLIWIAILGATALAGCGHATPAPSSDAEKTAFLGDPSKMPADQQRKLRDFQQQGAQKSNQRLVPKAR